MSKSTVQTDADVAVIGAGWAGLSAAAKCVQQGQQVLLIEAAPSIGGRARSIQTPLGTLDNGQHLFIGAYKEVLDLLALLDLPEIRLFIRKKLHLVIDSLAGDHLSLNARGTLPGPMPLLLGLLSAQGLSIAEKWSVIRCWSAISLRGFKLTDDMTVSDFLVAQKQSTRLINLFWAPLCIAALNTPIDKASAQIYLNVLNKTFTSKRTNSDFLFARTSLDKLLPSPVADYIHQHGSSIRKGERLNEIVINDQSSISLRTSKDLYTVKHLILATPYHQTQKLLSPFNCFTNIKQSLANMKHESITTLYMQFPESIQLEHSLHGLSDGIAQWYVDRRSCGQAGMIAAVISANGPHTIMDKASLTQAILTETQQLFPHWPAPLDSYLIREKRATFACTTNIGRLRPKPGAIGHHIWLAGDYLDTGLPATLEGAILSGVQCAQQLIESQQ